MRTDADLLLAWRGGEDRAGSELFRRHFASIYRFFHNKTPEVAEDLTQQTFTAVLESRDRIRGESSFRTFLFAVARNHLLMYLRKTCRQRRRFEPGNWSLIDARGEENRMLVCDDQHRLLASAMQRIPVDYQVTLELHYWEEMSVTEIAGVLDVAAGTIKSRLSRGRAMLAKALGELDATAVLVRSTVDGLDRWLRSMPGAVKREVAQ